MTAPDCPNPDSCPVPDPPTGIASDDLLLAELPENAPVCRSYELKWGYDSLNPGFGDTRFAPIATEAGLVVPSLYAGADDVSALLESVFHEVHHSVADRIIYEAVVRNWGLAFVRLPRALSLVDFRDHALTTLGISRDALLTTTAEHYPCTREWATWLHGSIVRGDRPEGILWHSRQAELHRPDSRREVFVLWGDRAPDGPGAYPLTGPGVRNLTEGPGRVLLDELAEDLGSVVVPAVD